jgi:hypothetical protein
MQCAIYSESALEIAKNPMLGAMSTFELLAPYWASGTFLNPAYFSKVEAQF